ncbi:hypothetical protein PRIC2_010380 [Phytophthora ramorum]
MVLPMANGEMLGPVEAVELLLPTGPGLEEMMQETITNWGTVTLKTDTIDALDKARPSSPVARRDGVTHKMLFRVETRLICLSDTVVNYLSRSTRSAGSVLMMLWRARINFYFTILEEMQVGWRLQQFVMLVLVVNIAVMASETLESPRFSGSDPAFAYVLSQNTCNCIEACFTILYVVEFAARWWCIPNQLQFWKLHPPGYPSWR